MTTIIGITAITSAIYVWHYKPMNAYESQVRQLEKTIDELAKAYSECETQKSKSSIESYIEGVGDDAVVPAVSLDDLHT